MIMIDPKTHNCKSNYIYIYIVFFFVYIVTK